MSRPRPSTEVRAEMWARALAQMAQSASGGIVTKSATSALAARFVPFAQAMVALEDNIAENTRLLQRNTRGIDELLGDDYATIAAMPPGLYPVTQDTPWHARLHPGPAPAHLDGIDRDHPAGEVDG